MVWGPHLENSLTLVGYIIRFFLASSLTKNVALTKITFCCRSLKRSIQSKKVLLSYFRKIFAELVVLVFVLQFLFDSGSHMTEYVLRS